MTNELTSPQQIAIWNQRMPEIAGRESSPDHRLVDKVTALDIRFKHVLDIGCGAGRNLVWLAKSGWTVTGMDWSPLAIATSKRSLDSAKALAKLVKGDFKRMPFGASSFMLIVSTSTLHHCKVLEFRRALMEIKRVLKPGGHAVISLPTKNNPAASTPGVWIEDGTLLPTVGDETGIPHHFFTEEEITVYAKAFRSVEVEVSPANTGENRELSDSPEDGGWFWVTLKN